MDCGMNTSKYRCLGLSGYRALVVWQFLPLEMRGVLPSHKGGASCHGWIFGCCVCLLFGVRDVLGAAVGPLGFVLGAGSLLNLVGVRQFVGAMVGCFGAVLGGCCFGCCFGCCQEGAKVATVLVRRTLTMNVKTNLRFWCPADVLGNIELKTFYLESLL